MSDSSDTNSEKDDERLHGMAKNKSPSTSAIVSQHRRFKKVAKKRLFTNPEALGLNIPKNFSDEKERAPPPPELRATRSKTAKAKAAAASAQSEESDLDGQSASVRSVASSNKVETPSRKKQKNYSP